MPGYQAGGAATCKEKTRNRKSETSWFTFQIFAEPLGLLHILDLLSQEPSSLHAEDRSIIKVLISLSMVMRRLKTGCSAHLVPGVGDAPGLIWPGEEQALLTNQLVWRDAELRGLHKR